MASVITSYSIHYTKLYDDEDLTDKKRTAAEVAVPVLYDFEPQTGKAIATRVAEIFDYVHNEARRTLSDAALQAELDRITSYNVCYTKLLRRRKQPS